jgi:DNA-binding MarR family transcriptional regulator
LSNEISSSKSGECFFDAELLGDIADAAYVDVQFVTEVIDECERIGLFEKTKGNLTLMVKTDTQ